MNCQQFESRLNQLLDEQGPRAVDHQSLLTQDATLAQHAAACGTCRTVLHSYRTMLAAIQLLPRPTTSAPLAQRVLAELAQADPTDGTIVSAGTALPAPASAVAPMSRGALGFALAAGLLLAATAWFFGRQPLDAPPTNVGSAPSEQIATTTPADDGTTVAPNPAPLPVEKAVAQAAHNLSDILVLLPGIDPPVSTDDAANGNAPRTGGWLSQMADGLAPLSRSTTGALDFLLEAVPEDVGEDS